MATEFQIVSKRPARRRAWTLAGVALAVLVVAGAVTAANLTVNRRSDVSSLYAERYDVGDRFVVSDPTIAPAAASAEAIGYEESPREITSGFPAARTALVADQWVYTVLVKENAVAAVAAGRFTIELALDGNSLGVLHVEQSANQAELVEGVKASFAVGPNLPTSGLYYLVVKAFTPAGTIIEYVIESEPSGSLKWIGRGGSIEGQENPAIALLAGETLRLKAKNGDGIVHNVGIKSGASLVSPPGWSANVAATGDETTIGWLATAGAFEYQCQYHPTTMKGTITVS